MKIQQEILYFYLFLI